MTEASLLESPIGHPMTVRMILFEGPRERCGELGLHKGDRLVVDGREGELLLIRKDAARTLRCPVELARFVEVE
jgi:hypothetical protein